MSYDRGHRFHQVIGDEFVHENLLINPGFETWQRGAGPFTATTASVGLFAADEWQIITDTTGSNLVCQKETVNQLIGSACAKYSHTHTGGIHAYSAQGFEMYLSMLNLPVTFSAWVKCGTANAVRVGIGNSIAVGLSSFHSGSGNWERLTALCALPATAPIIGVWPHQFGIVAFTDFTNTCSNVLVDGASVVVGNFPEGVPYVPPNPADDWEKCQRFYETGSSFFGHASSPTPTSSEWSPWLGFRVRKYATPTLTDTFSAGGGSYAGSIQSTTTASVEGIRLRIANLSGNSGGTYNWTAYIP